MSSVSKAAMPKAHQYPFGLMKCPLLRQSMPRIDRGSGQVPMGCFFYSFPVRITSASITVNCWDPPVTPEIQMGSAPFYFEGIRVKCTTVSTRALYLLRVWCARPLNPHSPINPTVHFLPMAGGWESLVLLRVFITMSGGLCAGNWSSNFRRRTPFCDCISLQFMYPCL